MVGATRASFLVQATVLLTPLLSLAAGYRPGRRTWAACALALAGCLLITADEAAAEGSSLLGAGGLQLGEWPCCRHPLQARSACAFELAGTAAGRQARPHADPPAPQPCPAGGDATILLSALFYSLVVVRMSGYARCLPAVQVRGRGCRREGQGMPCGIAVRGRCWACARRSTPHTANPALQPPPCSHNRWQPASR